MMKMRYLLVTLLKNSNNQIDEQVGFSRRIRSHDLQTCNVILDYKERKVLKCVIDGRRLDTDFQRLHEYYSRVYPVLTHQLMAEHAAPTDEKSKNT